MCKSERRVGVGDALVGKLACRAPLGPVPANPVAAPESQQMEEWYHMMPEADTARVSSPFSSNTV